MRVALICQSDEPLSREAVAQWLATVGDLVGVVVIQEPPGRTWQRVRREYRRRGSVGLLDVLLFRTYQRLRLARADSAFEARALAQIAARYPGSPAPPTLITDDPNGEATRAFLARCAPDAIVARCKTLLKREIYTLARVGTFVLHPGICPEYRNAHGCFWALAGRDVSRVGLTLLKVDDGVDTGPVYGHFYADIDERRETPFMIENRVLLDNLDAIGEKLRAAVAGQARPVDVSGRRSRVWGQPTLSAYVRWKLDARRHGRRGVLLYHDVVATGREGDSGFTGADADIYKLTPRAFEAHLRAFKARFPDGVGLVRGKADVDARRPLLTFDDGGVSALTAIAPALEALGLRGHFFITTDRIDTPGFLSADQVRELHRRGHVVGSHSASHPRIMSALSPSEIRREWQESIERLSSLLGERVRTASVPGGYGDGTVRPAFDAGIEVLFTSEPTRRTHVAHGVTVVGRFAVQRHTPADVAVRLAAGDPSPCLGQWIRWNTLKLIKRSLGGAYPAMRARLLAWHASRAN